VVIGDHGEEKKSARLDGPDDFHIEPSLIYHVCMGFPIQNIQSGTRSAANFTGPPYWTETGISVVSAYVHSRDETGNHLEEKSCALLVNMSNSLCFLSANTCIAMKESQTNFSETFRVSMQPSRDCGHLSCNRLRPRFWPTERWADIWMVH